MAGIPLQEIRDEVGGDLIRKILEALDIAADLHDQVQPVARRSAADKRNINSALGARHSPV